MEITFLGVVFAVIIVLLAIGRPLYQAIAGGMIVTAGLFHIPVTVIVTKIASVIINWSSLSVLLSLYLITFLQRILESRSQIRLAQQDLNGIFHNRRINTAGAAFFIGLLPSAASMILCADIVKDATEGYLDPKEQAFTASWFRHIPESVLPTYTAVLLMSNLSGVEISEFIVYMIVPVIALAGLGYAVYLHRIPNDTGTPASTNRLADFAHLIQHLWSLLLILILILVFHFQVVTSVLVSIALCIIIYRVTLDEIRKFIFAAFENVGKYLSCIMSERTDRSYRCVIAAAGCYGKTASAYLSDFWSAIFYSNCHQWFYRCHCYGNTAGFCGDSGRSPLNGIPYVHGPCSQPDLTYPCMSGGGSRLFSCDVRRYCKENTACFYCLLRINDAIL